jgi:hypothetical protein
VRSSHTATKSFSVTGSKVRLMARILPFRQGTAAVPKYRWKGFPERLE